MAAINPNAELESDVPKRATLTLIKIRAPEFDSDDEDDDFDEDDIAAIERRLGLTSEEDDDDDEESDDEKNGGPSDPEKTKKARAEALIKALKDDEEMDDLELTNGINGTKSIKGKAKAVEDELDEDEDEDEDSEGEDIKEYVICTLDPEKVSHTN
jgi:FK506-binding nuclear protein